MQFRAAMTNALPALLCAAILGCGGSSSTPGTMSVHLVDGPESDYTAITLQVKKLEIHGPTGWETLSDFTKTEKGVLEIDLLSLRGVDSKGLPIKATLTDHKALPEGHYDQMRMLLGAGNTVTLRGSTVPSPLKVPSGMQSGLKFPVSFDVAPNTTRDVFIDMDAHRSIFLHQTGGSDPKYLLRPVVHAVDRLVTGYITGRLTSASGAPLVGVTVMAETSDGVGHPNVVRSVETVENGMYVLDLLPAGGSYYVVAQPVTVTGTPPVTTVYKPKASSPIPISETSPSATYDASFDATTAFGSVRGTIAQVAAEGQGDMVMAISNFGTTALVVRSEPADVDRGVSPPTETYAIEFLPLFDGGYTLAVERSSGTDPTLYTWLVDGGAPVLGTTATPPFDLVNRVLQAPTSLP